MPRIIVPERGAIPTDPFSTFVSLVERKTTVPYYILEQIVSELRVRERWWRHWKGRGDLSEELTEARTKIKNFKSQVERLKKKNKTLQETK